MSDEHCRVHLSDHHDALRLAAALILSVKGEE